MDKQLRLHVVCLPHTVPTKEYLCCAYTQKHLNFCKMMKSLGHTVYDYSGEGSEAQSDEHINIITHEQRKHFWGSNDWRKEFFAIEWSSDKPYWMIANAMAIDGIRKRIKPGDFICLIGGHCQKPIADAFPNYKNVEYGIGYTGVFSQYKVFESYAHMHCVYGEMKQGNGNPSDTVINNYFDVNDFKVADKKEDYAFFIGRLIQRKGVQLAIEACTKAGIKLLIAGQGVISHTNGQNGKISKIQTAEFSAEGNFEYIGTVDVNKRAELMSKAKAVIVPTTYIEPFGGVAVETMMSGTPVIASDWGAFTETVIDGFTGYRIHDVNDIIKALGKVSNLNSAKIAEYARNRWSLDVIRHQYDEYFKRLG